MACSPAGRAELISNSASGGVAEYTRSVDCLNHPATSMSEKAFSSSGSKHSSRM
ncbi:MAG TPA: hypothetical protein VG892_09495 [Terriglobales bacterium]|nr:hypothetical protein [Terriglobales bacterium]